MPHIGASDILGLSCEYPNLPGSIWKSLISGFLVWLKASANDEK